MEIKAATGDTDQLRVVLDWPILNPGKRDGQYRALPLLAIVKRGTYNTDVVWPITNRCI